MDPRRGGPQVYVLNQQAAKKEEGRKVQLENIQAGKTVADVIRTCLGPRAMLKMLMDPMGGIVMTSDGNAILREIVVQHPAAKSMIEIARTQDEEVGDGTTSVIILTGEVLAVAAEFMEQQMHPSVVIGAYYRALEDALSILNNELSVSIDTSSDALLLSLIASVLGTKLASKWSSLACKIALSAVKTVLRDECACGREREREKDAGKRCACGNSRREIDIKRYAKVEKIPGGEVEESVVMRGVMLNKDVTHPKMRRRIERPRVLLLDCPLEYTKGESQTNVEFLNDAHFSRLLQIEEEFVEGLCADIIAHKPDVVITEKGVSDLAQHFLLKHNITALRRVRKSDNNRIARACGATIVNRTDEIKESDIGTECGLFEIRKVGDEYFTFIDECENPKACTIVLRGASKDLLMEVERNLQDAMQAARNVLLDPRIVPGGGATEIALSIRLNEKAKSVEGVAQWPYRAVAKALEVIPRTLIQNCGGNTIRTLTGLRAKHAQSAGEKGAAWGIDGDSGEVVDMSVKNIWDPLVVKTQTIKTAIETAIMLLRIDAIVSGIKKNKGGAAGGAPQGAPEGGEQAPQGAEE